MVTMRKRNESRKSRTERPMSAVDDLQKMLSDQLLSIAIASSEKRRASKTDPFAGDDGQQSR